MVFSFTDIFNPTDEKKQAQYDHINGIVDNVLKEFGPCCAVCKHCRRKQVSPYYEYCFCKLDPHLVFGDARKRCCPKYEFVGYLKVKEKEKEKKNESKL